MSKCQAIVFLGDGTYELREFDIPHPRPGEAVLKVEAVGLCGSDVSQLRGYKHVPGEASLVVPGHEIVGRVVELGPGADLGVQVGDRVGVDQVVMAPSGESGALEVRGANGYSPGLDEGHGLWGGCGEYMGILPGTQLSKLTEDRPADELTLFEPLGRMLNWVELARVEPGDTVVVQGPGHMGLICVAVAKALGAGRIVVTGTSADGLRLEAARELGAEHTIDVEKEDPVARLREITGGSMAEAVFDMAAEATATVRLAIEMAGQNGRILLAGLKSKAPVEIVSDKIVMKSLTICGGAGGTRETMRHGAEWLNAGRLPTEKLRGESFPLERYDEALALVERRLPGRDAVRVNLVHRP